METLTHFRYFVLFLEILAHAVSVFCSSWRCSRFRLPVYMPGVGADAFVEVSFTSMAHFTVSRLRGSWPGIVQ